MKKIIMLFFTTLLVSVGICNAQVYRATEFAMGVRNNNGSITWDKWEKSTVKMSIDWDNEVVEIFSKTPQKYIMISADDVKETRDGKELDIYAVDDDGIKCILKLCVLRSGVSQFYVYYNDVAWVYNILKL